MALVYFHPSFWGLLWMEIYNPIFFTFKFISYIFFSQTMIFWVTFAKIHRVKGQLCVWPRHPVVVPFIHLGHFQLQSKDLKKKKKNLFLTNTISSPLPHWIKFGDNKSRQSNKKYFSLGIESVYFTVIVNFFFCVCGCFGFLFYKLIYWAFFFIWTEEFYVFHFIMSL